MPIVATAPSTRTRPARIRSSALRRGVKIGRGSWRGRGEISGGGRSFKKKKRNTNKARVLLAYHADIFNSTKVDNDNLEKLNEQHVSKTSGTQYQVNNTADNVDETYTGTS